jgi:ATP-binding cassette subfamily C protein
MNTFWKFKKKRVKTPTILQMEALECGAASLGICLAYFGKFVPLEELRETCGVSRDGSNAFNLMQAAKKYGLEAHGYKLEISDLETLTFPVIIFWNFNHFVVLEGINKNYFFINDPARGPVKISHEEFDKAFTGVVITVEKTEEFKKSGSPESVILMLKERLKNVKAPLIYIGIISLALIVPGLSVPALMQFFYDQVLIKGRFEWGKSVTLGLFFCALATFILVFLRQKILNRLKVKLSIVSGGTFLWHILRLPINFYMQRFSGEIANRQRLNYQVVNILTGPLATTCMSILLIIFYVSMMIIYNIPVALICIITALANLFVLWIINRSRNDAYARMQQELGKSIGYSISCLQSMESIKSSGTENDAFGAWAGYYAKQLNAQREINIKDAILINTPTFFIALSRTALLGIGTYEILNGNLTVGMLIALQALLQAFFLPVNQLLDLGSTLQMMKINIVRLNDVLKNDIDPILEVQENLHFEDQARFDGYLELKNVTFGYSPLEEPLIKDLSIKLNPGQRVALVGPSGCGKSTISKLISGIYKPWSGSILFDGKPLSEIPRNVFQNSFGSVDQKIYLFSGSIKDNLTLWDKTISDKDLINAASDAEIHEVILSRPKGYEMQLNEGGQNLSGGEGQRIEIARALINNPRVLILDEATSSLDSKSEETISKNIRKRGCTCVMVAHRLSTIRECDEIIVLDKGKVIQRGSHENLRNIPGVYKDLVDKESLRKDE